MTTWRGTTLAERFWSRVDKTGECWLWTGPIAPSGYGFQGSRLAHRIAWELTYGAIPSKPRRVIDHLCRVRNCVRPDHLDLTTDYVNVVERGRGPSAQAARATQCSAGHELDEANTYVRRDGGGRQCRKCKAIRERDRQQRMKPVNDRTCPCGASLASKKMTARYCSDACRMKAWLAR